MEEYLMPRETLEEFVDELMKKRALPVNSAEEVNDLRERLIKSLDDEVSMAIFGKLDKPQLAALNQLLSDGNVSEAVFQGFFDRVGIDVGEVIADAMKRFGEKYLGGKNGF